MNKINLDKIGLNLFRILLVLGIVFLASQGVEGWGWLVFILLCTL